MDLILPAANGHRVASNSNRNENQGHLPGVKTAGAYGLEPCHFHVLIA